MKILLKVALARVAVGVFAMLIVRSARSTRAEPFTIRIPRSSMIRSGTAANSER